MIHQGKKHHQGGKKNVLILEKANVRVIIDVSYIGCCVRDLLTGNDIVLAPLA